LPEVVLVAEGGEVAFDIVQVVADAFAPGDGDRASELLFQRVPAAQGAQNVVERVASLWARAGRFGRLRAR
jgi:hypothetical protein